MTAATTGAPRAHLGRTAQIAEEPPAPTVSSHAGGFLADSLTPLAGTAIETVSEDLTPVMATRDMLMQGYRQVTDAYLYGLCIKKRLVFVSFDAGLTSLFRPGDARLKSLKILPCAPLH